MRSSGTRIPLLGFGSAGLLGVWRGGEGMCPWGCGKIGRATPKVMKSVVGALSRHRHSHDPRLPCAHPPPIHDADHSLPYAPRGAGVQNVGSTTAPPTPFRRSPGASRSRSTEQTQPTAIRQSPAAATRRMRVRDAARPEQRHNVVQQGGRWRAVSSAPVPLCILRPAAICRFLAVGCWGTEDDISEIHQRYLTKTGAYLLPMAADPRGEVFSRFGPSQAPSFYIVDRTNTISFHAAGYESDQLHDLKLQLRVELYHFKLAQYACTHRLFCKLFTFRRGNVSLFKCVAKLSLSGTMRW